MSESASTADFVMRAQPSEGDYLHAQTAHGSWGQVTAWKGTRNKIRTALLMIAGVAFICVPMFGTQLHFPKVIINLASLIAVAGIPTFLVLVIIIMSAFSKRIEPPPEIVERPLNEAGVYEPKKARAKNGLFGWVLFIGLAIMIFLLMQRNPPAPGVGSLVDEPDEPALTEIPGPMFFIGALILSSVGIGGLVGVAARQKRQFRHQIQSFLVPRTWEASEEHLLETDAKHSMTMQWSYFTKFLETPRVLMLYPDDYRFHLIPRSAFTSDEQYERFIGLLMRKVPNGIMQPREARGFAVEPMSPGDRGSS